MLVAAWLLPGWVAALPAQERWTEALAAMPLKTHVAQLNRTNCVAVMLNAFQSNAVVKALIFMPGATDEFYMFRRAQAQLPQASPSLLDAVMALTNQTRIRATFALPFLLLHTAADPLTPDILIKHPATAARLQRTAFPEKLIFNDADWDSVQPALKWRLKLDIRPWRGSPDSWHFYRHSFAGWGLSGWEAMEAAALAGKSRFTVRRNQVLFEPDLRLLKATGDK